MPGVAFVIGLLVGGAGPDPEPTESAAYRSVEQRAATLAADLEQSERALEESEQSVEESQQAAEDAELAAEQLREREAELAAQAAALEARAAEIAAQEVAAATAVAAAAAEAPPVEAPVQTPAVQAPAVQAAPASVYYKNCDAARAAGAAPVRRGDPGYGSHLDRDDDGVGCE